MHKDISTYNRAQKTVAKKICMELADIIDTSLKNTESKIWHRSPVWFIDGNPVVAYSVLKSGVQLLFFSGQSFKEFDLIPEGSFKAAARRYTDVSEIRKSDLKRWLKQSVEIQWDYKNIVKRKGKLVRINKKSKKVS